MSFSVSSPFPFLISLLFAAASGVLRARPARRGLRRVIASEWAAPVFAVIVVLFYWVLFGWLELLPLAAALLGLWPGRPEAVPSSEERATWLDRQRLAPLAAGLVTAALSWWIWGFVSDPPAAFHDENALRLQAGIFAGGRWADPPPPLDRFFDQMHVLSTPRRAAKYLPGHSLVLAPAFALGFPAAVPLALDFAAGGLLFALARRASGGTVALLAWLLWLTAPGCLRYRSSYFSELTTTALWLAGWWALWSWKETSRARWLALFGLCVGVGAITRPLTTVAFTLPTGLVLLRLVARRRAWAALSGVVVIGGAALFVVPLWSARTTGDARMTPLSLYTRQVLPWDRLGFGLDKAPPARELSEDARDVARQFRGLHARHTLENLPGILGIRLVTVLRDIWGGRGGALFAFAVLGAFLAPAPARVALATTALLVLLYLSYAHFPIWSLYYAESFGVLAYATAVGLRHALRALAPSPSSALSAAAPWLLASGLAVAAVPAVLEGRARYEAGVAGYRRFTAVLHGLPPRPAVVFVRYGPRHDPHRSLIVNGPDLRGAPLWVVYDRGPENARLCSLAPERTAYRYDERSGSLTRLAPGCEGPSP